MEFSKKTVKNIINCFNRDPAIGYEDYLQEAKLIFLNGNLKEKEPKLGYVILKNRLIDVLRTSKYKKGDGYQNNFISFEKYADLSFVQKQTKPFFNLKFPLELILNNLTNSEKKVIKRYFYEGWGLKEIGNEMNLSGSRISQIKNKSLKKLKIYIEQNKNIELIIFSTTQSHLY